MPFFAKKGGDKVTGYEIANLIIQCVGITATVILSIIGIIISMSKKK